MRIGAYGNGAAFKIVAEILRAEREASPGHHAAQLRADAVVAVVHALENLLVFHPAKEFFGLERLRAALSWMPEDVSPEDLVNRLREDVRRFTDGAEAADDITLVALRWQ